AKKSMPTAQPSKVLNSRARKLPAATSTCGSSAAIIELIAQMGETLAQYCKMIQSTVAPTKTFSARCTPRYLSSANRSRSFMAPAAMGRDCRESSTRSVIWRGVFSPFAPFFQQLHFAILKFLRQRKEHRGRPGKSEQTRGRQHAFEQSPMQWQIIIA